MVYIIWLVLLVLFIFSLSFNKLPIWIPTVIYLLVVFFRVKEKISNNKDWLKISVRDEKIKLEEVRNEMARRGLTFSSIRNQAEEKIVEDFKYERKKRKRKFENELINSLFLK